MVGGVGVFVASSVSWADAQAVAGAAASAERWRSRLAEVLRDASGAKLATVWTCPPAQPLEARGSTAPPEIHPAIDSIVTHQIPLVERGEDGASKRRGKLTFRPYLPLERARNAPLARKVFLESYAPVGIEALAFTWLLDADGLPLGFMAIGDAGTGRELLERIGEPLELVARRASQTLQDSLALARGLGAIPPPPPAPQLRVEQLTVRERQVARLVAEGHTNEGVARQLSMAEQTVGVHLRRIFRKLGVHSRNELLARGVVALTEQVPSSVRPGRGGRRSEG